MSNWQADASSQSFASGAKILVISPHEMVRIVTADRLSIETPDRNRISALVIDRTRDHLTLSMPDGRPLCLSNYAIDDSADESSGTPFSRQLWIVN
jgi:hypothetical protein